MSDDDVGWSRSKLAGAVREALLSALFRPLIAVWRGARSPGCTT